MRKVPFEEQKGSCPQAWCSIFPLFIYHVILNCLHSSCPTATRAQRAQSTTTRAAKAEKEETRTPWKSASRWLPASHPRQISLYRGGMDVAEEASTLLKLLSKHPVAFSTDFNSLKALQKTAWGFLFNDRNKGWTVCVKPEVQSSTQEYTGCHVRTKRPPWEGRSIHVHWTKPLHCHFWTLSLSGHN